MGADLFDHFPELTATADTILAYSIKDLCLNAPASQLAQTRYTQPALYVVNALSYRQRLRDQETPPDFVAGHSLGEYSALECAGVISFEDGLRLVKKRGELMSQAPPGAMAAIIGLAPDQVGELLAEHGLDALDVANYNSPTQTIISGLHADIRQAQAVFEQHRAMYIPLNVGGAFHSRYMQAAQNEFRQYLAGFRYGTPTIPVLANIHAQPYVDERVADNLAKQLTHSVRWLDSMHFLLDQGVTELVEVGPGDVLTKLARAIRSQYRPAAAEEPVPAPAAMAPESEPEPGRVSTFAGVTPVSATAAPETAAPLSPQQRVNDWNRLHAIGTSVYAKGYPQPLLTQTTALVLFGHRAAIYLQGYHGYFALDEITPAN